MSDIFRISTSLFIHLLLFCCMLFGFRKYSVFVPLYIQKNEEKKMWFLFAFICFTFIFLSVLLIKFLLLSLLFVIFLVFQILLTPMLVPVHSKDLQFILFSFYLFLILNKYETYDYWYCYFATEPLYGMDSLLLKQLILWLNPFSIGWIILFQ